MNASTAKQVLQDRSAQMQMAFSQAVQKMQGLGSQGRKVVENKVQAAESASAEGLII